MNQAIINAINSNSVTSLATVINRDNINQAINDKGSTPLIFAATFGHFEQFMFLLKRGADINIKNNLSRNALIYLLKSNNYDNVAYALEQGADANIQDQEGNTIFHYLVDYQCSYELLELVSTHSENLLLPNKQGANAFAHAASRNERHMVSFLLSFFSEHNIITESEEKILRDFLSGNYKTKDKEIVSATFQKLNISHYEALFDTIDFNEKPAKEEDILLKVLTGLFKSPDTKSYEDVRYLDSLAELSELIANIVSECDKTDSAITAAQISAYFSKGEYEQEIITLVNQLADCELGSKTVNELRNNVGKFSLLITRNVSPEKRSYHFLIRWFLLLSPFFQITELLALIQRSSPARFRDVMRAISFSILKGAHDMPQWFVFLANASPKNIKGMQTDLMTFLTPFLNPESLQGYTRDPWCIPRDVSSELFSNNLGAVLNYIEDFEYYFRELLSPEAQKHFADQASSYELEKKPGTWFHIARQMANQKIVLQRLPTSNDHESIEQLKQWLLKDCPIDMTLTYLKMIGHENGNFRGGTDFNQWADLQYEVLKNRTNEFEFSDLLAEHVAALNSIEYIQYLIPKVSTNTRETLISILAGFSDHDDINMELASDFADVYARKWSESYKNIPVERLRLIWQSLDKEEMVEKLNTTDHDRAKKAILSICYRQLKYCNEPVNENLQLFIALYQENSDRYDALVAQFLECDDESDLQAVMLLWETLGPVSKNTLAQHFAENIEDLLDYNTPKSLPDVAELMLNDEFATLMEYSEKTKKCFFPYISEQCFELAVPYIESSSKSSATMAAVAKGLVHISPETIENSGLYHHKIKAIRDATYWSLYLRNDKLARDQMLSLLEQKAFRKNWLAAGHFLDCLEQGDEAFDISGYDKLFQASFEQFHEQSKQEINTQNLKKLTRIWSADLEQYWPFEIEALQWALILLANDNWDQLPRYTRQCFAFLSPQQQKNIATFLVESWLNGESDMKDKWVLALVTQFGDDNLILSLQKAINDWHKRSYRKAIYMVEALAALDTPYALSIIDAIAKGKKYQWDVRDTARQCLKNAAKKRGITLLELYDELVPDLNMTSDGLILDVGPYQYQVNLLSDLTLRIKNSATGKVTKSLPKMKKDEDPNLRESAENQFKLLKKNIKPVLKQLKARMDEAYDCAQTWPVQRWKQLFLVHPILNLIGKSLIWQAIENNEPSSCFRIAEDNSLIDLDDNTITLIDGEVRLLHAVEMNHDQIIAWKEHFQDYEIVPFLDQLTDKAYYLSDEEKEKNELLSLNGAKSDWGTFKRSMEKWNYGITDQDGAHIFGFARAYPISGWEITIDMSECDVSWGHTGEVIIENISFSNNGNPCDLSSVPRQLISNTVAKINSICQLK